MYHLPKNKETISIERKPHALSICSESKSKSRNKKEYHLLLKPKNNLYCSQSSSKASTANTKNTLLSYSSSAKKENSKNLVMKNSTAIISQKRYNSKEQKNIYHNELFPTKKFSQGQERKKEEQNDSEEYLKNVITIQSTFRMFNNNKKLFADLHRRKMKEEACVKIISFFCDMKREVLRMIRHFRPIVIDKVLGEKIKYIDWLLRTKCLVEKQKAFDLLKEKAILHRMKTKVERFSNLVDKAQNKNAILDGNEIIQNLRNNYKKKKLKESKENINSNKGSKQIKTSTSKKEKKKVIPENSITFLINFIIKTYLKNCFRKIRLKAKEVSLKKIIPIADRNKKQYLSRALTTIKDNAKLLTIIMNNKAYLIQHKFINSFPNIKKKRETLALIKSYKVSQRIFLQSVTMIQRWFIHSLNRRKDKNKKNLKELFISHFLYRHFKPFMINFLLSYRMSKENNS